MDWSARAWKELRKEDRFRHCSVTSCSTNSTASWSTGGTASFVMRTTVTQRTRGSTGDGEHHALHHTKAQAQGKRGEECGGTTAGTEVSRVQLLGWSGHQ